MIMMPEFVNMTWSSNFINVVVFSLSSFFSKFDFFIITGFGVMTNFVYKGLTRNLKYGNTRLWIFPYKWALKQAKGKPVKDVIITKWKLLFFILDLWERGRLRGMHSKFKTSVWSKDSYISKLVLKYIWSKFK